MFVFRNRSLYVTVETREVCAALVALFRPAGTGSQQTPHPAAAATAQLTNGSNGSGSGGITTQSSEDGNLLGSVSVSGSAAKRRYASPSSPSNYGQSVWGGGRPALPRRVSENAASARSGESRATSSRSESRSRMSSGSDRHSSGWAGDGLDILGVLGGGGGSTYAGGKSQEGADILGVLGGGGGSTYTGGRPRNRGGGKRAGILGNLRGMGRTHEGRLKRSASETAGAELLDVDAASSSSDEETREARVASTAGAAASSSLESSRHRSPQSASESPDAIMRARMVGFGSADLGIEDDPRPKRAGRTSSIRPRWPARFTDSGEKKSMSAAEAAAAATTAAAAAAVTTTGRLKTAGLAVEDSADLEEDAWVTSTEGSSGVSEIRGTGGDPVATPPRNRHDDTSPLAVRDEDRLVVASLRRPASAPATVLAAEARESSSFQDTPPAQHVVKPRTTANNSSPPERHGRTSPPLARGRGSAPPHPPASASAAAPLHNEGDYEFAFSRRPEPPQPPAARGAPVEARPPHPPPARKEPIAVDEAFVVEKRKIPPLTRPAAADPAQLQQLGLSAKAAAAVANIAGGLGREKEENTGIYRDGRYERSLSPPSPQPPALPPQQVRVATRGAAAATPNGARVAASAVVDRRDGRGPLGDPRYNRSSSMDSLEVDEPDSRHVRRPLNFGTSASFSEDDLVSSGQKNKRMSAAVEAAVDVSPQDLRREGRPDQGRGARARGRSRLRDADGGQSVTPPLGNKVEPASMSYTSRDLPFLDERHASVGEEMGGAPAAAPAAATGGVGEEAATRRAERISPVDRLESFATSRTDSFGPPTRDDAALSKLTIQTALSHDDYAAPSEAGTALRSDSSSLPFATTPRPAASAAAAARGSLNSGRGSRESRGSYDRRGSGGTDLSSPGSPPGGAVGEVRASLVPHSTGTRAIPMISGLHLGGGALRDQRPQGPSGFEELWAVLEPEWDINASFGASFAPKVNQV